MIRLHKRVAVVDAATREISLALWRAIETHQLTHGEVTSILAGELAAVAKYQIRSERHPDDPSKRGGEE